MIQAKTQLATMTSKRIFLILLVVSYGLPNQALGDDDDCGDDLDLSLSYRFNFTTNGTFMQWELKSHTDCPVLYHLVVRDYERGVIQNEYLEGTSARLEGISPCVAYELNVTAINEAFPEVEGPPVTMGIVFAGKAQKVPTLGAIDIQATSINMAWALEGDANRCSLINLYIDGGNYFNFSIPLQDLSDTSTVQVEIKSLRPSSMYFFRVFVENVAGISQAAQLSVQTLDLTEN